MATYKVTTIDAEGNEFTFDCNDDETILDKAEEDSQSGGAIFLG